MTAILDELHRNAFQVAVSFAIACFIGATIGDFLRKRHGSKTLRDQLDFFTAPQRRWSVLGVVLLWAVIAYLLARWSSHG